jgi:hypothetical protein
MPEAPMISFVILHSPENALHYIGAPHVKKARITQFKHYFQPQNVRDKGWHGLCLYKAVGHSNYKKKNGLCSKTRQQPMIMSQTDTIPRN